MPKTPTILAATALVVAALGATPLGHAAGKSSCRQTPSARSSSEELRHGLKVKNGTLTAADFAAGQLPAGPQGLTGAKGDAGPQGGEGRPGPARRRRARPA